MSRDPGILHEEICVRLDTIIRLLEKKDNWLQSPMKPTCVNQTYTQVCTCANSRMNTAGVCLVCGLPKATPT